MSNPLTPCEEAAAARGLHIWRPADDELYIDIDDTHSEKRFRMARKLLREMIVSVKSKASPSGRPGHKHITVKLNRRIGNEHERVALQAAMGSDLAREGLSVLALSRGATSVSVFFEKTEQPPTQPVAAAVAEDRVGVREAEEEGEAMKSASEWIKNDGWLFDDETSVIDQADFIRAIQRDALEAAAKACEEMWGEEPSCCPEAAAIRALIPPEKPPSPSPHKPGSEPT